MVPIDLNNLFLTCKTIVNTEIINHCDAIIEKVDTLFPLANTKGRKKKLKKMRKKTKKLKKFQKK